MPSIVYFRTGDRVRVALKRSDALYNGEVPNGTEGTVVSLRETKTPFDYGDSTTVAAVVDFPGVGERIVGLGVLEFVRTGGLLPDGMYLAVDANCPACGNPERRARLDEHGAIFSCRNCPYISRGRDT